MNKKSLLAIERIISCINELTILTKNKKAEYFYDGYEMNALIDLISEIELNLGRISNKIKNKYNKIDWKKIEKEKECNGMGMNIGKAWILASQTLKDEFLNDLINILEHEVPDYYKNLCNKKHEEFVRKQKSIK